jgi:hypothetical protein
MRVIIHRILICLIIIFSFILLDISVYCQDPVILNNINKCVDRNEKVLVHLEKLVYVSGDFIQYKAYIVNAVNTKLSNKSKIVYFDLISPNNKIVLSWRSNVKNSVVIGRILIPDTLQGGAYIFRAYTNWMRNYSPDFYNSNTIYITSFSDIDTTHLQVYNYNNIENSKISFFPEGGNLLEGIGMKVGLKLNQNASNICTCNIKVKNPFDSLLTTFQIRNIGSFYIKPEPGKSYYAEIISQSGITESYPLVQAKRFGYSLKCIDNYHSIQIDVFGTGDDRYVNSAANLQIWAHNKKHCDTLVYLNNGEGKLSLEKSKLPQGILFIVLFDRNRDIVCKRLYYNEPKDLSLLKIGLTKKIYKPGEKIKLQLELSDQYGIDSADLSISVTESNPIANNASHIQSQLPYCLFASELSNRTDILNNFDSINYEQVDDLLLTAKPKSYLWNFDNTAKTQPCKYFLESKAYILSGKIYNQTTSLPISNALLLLSYPDSVVLLKYCRTDAYGVFKFVLDQSFDNKDLILQVADFSNINDIAWELDRRNDIENLIIKAEKKLDVGQQKYLSNDRKLFIINSVYQDSLNINYLDLPTKNITTKNDFFGIPNFIRYPADYTELPNFEEIGDNLLPGLKFRNNEDISTISIYDFENKNIYKNNIGVFVNGVFFNNLNYLASMNSKMIKKISLCSSEILYGTITFSGLLSIITYDGKIPGSVFNPAAQLFSNSVEPNSYYSFSNSNENTSKSSNIPDFRNTLYWNPLLEISGQKATIIEFYVSDLKATYDITINGITKSGRQIFATSKIVVK